MGAIGPAHRARLTVLCYQDLERPSQARRRGADPNPFTSGGAKWKIVAAYSSQLRQGKTKKQAEAFVRTLFHHVSVQDSSARNALKTFLSGKGDVLLTYENEAILPQK